MRRLPPALLAVVFAACSGVAGPAPTAATTAAPVPTTTEAVPSTTAAVPSTADAVTSTTAGVTTTTEPGTLVEVVVVGGAVSGGGRVEVDLGERVVLRVTSDVADEVHVHGYDVRADVAAGGTIELAFTAGVPGIFEVELEVAGLPLVDLVVGA